ncbi:hypothetical protein B0I27_102270 [Arcticibacter pallidicorallinus]|uniref:O-antigen ligase-like membrane protein n=1 Tax=Arcticibacter pallidicorallinus TaxID=1259464 RepID=A0A2T0U994_9SPHI|nr:hypothetical protein [Arcticibacter pallidicorallinus]PRY54503.1 hypothetical protein B0I27_102270 [Arcticibacter pallidicorallinus]
MYKTANDPPKVLKQAIWVYFLLILFEGALRKWVLPQLADPLLVVRDPIAIFLIGYSWYKGVLPNSLMMYGMMALTVAATVAGLTLGHGNLTVAVYGARIFLLHFPLIFVIGTIFRREDVLEIGEVTLWITLPMAILIVFQFYSPQSAFVNWGVGGSEEGAGFSGANGFMRPPATFSFTNGTAHFFGFAGIFCIYHWLKTEKINKLLLIMASVGVLIAIPFSISRTLTFMLGLTVLAAFVAVWQNPRYVKKMLITGASLTLLVLLLSKTELLGPAIDAFLARFTSASEVEGGMQGTFIDRFLGGMYDAVLASPNAPFFGQGIGMGTNAGTQLLTGDSTDFLISEGEWGRLIGEMGLLFGITAILIRTTLAVKIGLQSIKKVSKGDILPWMLFTSSFVGIVQGQWAQPTNLGFNVLMAGLTLAALKPQKTLWRILKRVELCSPESLETRSNETSLQAH